MGSTLCSKGHVTQWADLFWVAKSNKTPENKKAGHPVNGSLDEHKRIFTGMPAPCFLSLLGLLWGKNLTWTYCTLNNNTKRSVSFLRCYVLKTHSEWVPPRTGEPGWRKRLYSATDICCKLTPLKSESREYKNVGQLQKFWEPNTSPRQELRSLPFWLFPSSIVSYEAKKGRDGGVSGSI